MKNQRINLSIIISIILFSIISIISIYMTRNYLSISYQNLYLKQLFFYIIGSIVAIFITLKGFNLIKRYHFLIYIGINILLLFLLFYGVPVNGSKCWFYISSFSFQPSELMKISLIITLSMTISKYLSKKNTLKDEFILLLKLFIITLIPSILTFLEPDTGVVIIYFLTLLSMLIFLGLNKKWYIISISILLLLVLSFIALYIFNKDFLLNILPSSYFYRLDRILNWQTSSGYQLEKSLMGISGGGVFGFGFNQNPVYFPEPQTDFIFSIISEEFGFLILLF